MDPKPDFDIQDYLEIESGVEESRKKQTSQIPYPDGSDYDGGRVVSMPEAGAAPSQYLSENYTAFDTHFDRSTDTHHSGDMNASIPSITVQGDEANHAHEIYSPLYVNPESPYDAASPFDHASPLAVPFPNVASPIGSPGYAGSDWGEDAVPQAHIPFNNTSKNPNPLNWRMRGETFGEFKTNQTQSWDQEAHSFDQLIEDILEPQVGSNMQNQPSQMHIIGSNAGQAFPQSGDPGHGQHLSTQDNSQSLQVPGNQGYYYGSSGSEHYLSAPNSPMASPTLSPSSPRSGRSSPLPRRPRAYSSPYDVSTDGDASSPGDTGFITGSRRRVKKNPSLYPCDQCDKKFTRAYNLRSHMRTHTHERPFACSVCGKAFARQHDRKRHEDLHTGEKRFVCSGTLFSQAQWGCGRRFARADALGRHFRTEAGKACIGPLREDIVSKIGQTVDVSEGIIFQGYVDGTPRLLAEADDENQTRRAVIISALTEQIKPDY